MIYLGSVISANEKNIIENIYEKTNGILYGYAKDILMDSHLAEDAVQETFIRFTKNISAINILDDRKTMNYLITVVKNVCFDIRSKNKQGNIVLEDSENCEFVEKGSVEDVVVRFEEYDYLKKAIAVLDEKFRKPMIMRYYMQMNEKEIADELRTTRENVGNKIFRAKRKIREYIDKKKLNE